jgi:RNA polymerase sigma-70 factor (ECF subfamily)
MSNSDSTNDPQIDEAIQRVRAGDTTAFETVVRKFERSMRAQLAVNSPPGVDVDEIAQRSFVAAFTRLDEFKPGSDFGAWLFTIARYQLKTETTRLRRVADYHTRYAPDLLHLALEKHVNNSMNLHDVRLDHLKKCVETLGEHLRRFVNWRYEEEIPLEEIASRCDRSVPAIKKQLWKIRRKLQDCVEQRLAVEGESS